MVYNDKFIAYEYEKLNIIRNLHDLSMHRGIGTLYYLVKNQNFWWNNIYKDTKEFISSCYICQSLHQSSFNKPDIKQILTNKPRDRYVMDLTDIKPNINDKKYNFKYILNIIDHYSKLTGSYLLVKKEANEVLNALNNFISIYGSPSSLQCDNGLEFKNKKIKEFCLQNNINLIFSSVRHPSTNGVCERIHREITKSLYAEKLKKNGYDLKFALSSAVRAQNNVYSSVTKHKPFDLFFGNNDNITEEVKINMIKSQFRIKKNLKPLFIDTKVLICEYYQKKGNNLTIKFRKKGNYLIPGTVIGNGSGNIYPIRIDKKFNELNKNDIFNIDYRLIKEVNIQIYNKILNSHNEYINNNIKDLEMDFIENVESFDVENDEDNYLSSVNSNN